MGYILLDILLLEFTKNNIYFPAIFLHMYASFLNKLPHERLKRSTAKQSLYLRSGAIFCISRQSFFLHYYFKIQIQIQNE
jgi:hypothetical protein